jgi:outer membrane receptor for monomeric catechols
MLAMVASVHYHSQNAPRGHGMPIGLMRVAAATLLLLCCFAKEAPVADAKARDAAVGSGRAGVTHHAMNRATRRHVLRRAPYRANGASWSRATQPIGNEPGATVIARQNLDDWNATTLRDGVHMVPGVIVGR